MQASRNKDGYTASKLPKVCAAAFSETGAKAIGPALRTWVDFLFGNSMLLRSNNWLSMNLPDLSIQYLEHEGPSGAEQPVYCVVALLDHGKSTFTINYCHILSTKVTEAYLFSRRQNEPAWSKGVWFSPSTSRSSLLPGWCSGHDVLLPVAHFGGGIPKLSTERGLVWTEGHQARQPSHQSRTKFVYGGVVDDLTF